MTITPQTHPAWFRPIEIGPYTYYARFVHNGITAGVREDVMDAYRNAWMKATGATTFDQAAYAAWCLTKEGQRKTDEAALAVLLIPSGDAPAFSEELLDFLSYQDMQRALGFFEKDYDARMKPQTESTENS